MATKPINPNRVSMVQKRDYCWDVLVDNEVMVEDESYMVASTIMFNLTSPVADTSECGEVADTIRRRFES